MTPSMALSGVWLVESLQLEAPAVAFSARSSDVAAGALEVAAGAEEVELVARGEVEEVDVDVREVVDDVTVTEDVGAGVDEALVLRPGPMSMKVRTRGSGRPTWMLTRRSRAGTRSDRR
jgi:hypothetical protein